MPQSRTVFAVSLQVHPELLYSIMPLLHPDVNAYYCLSDNSFCTGNPSLEILYAVADSCSEFSFVLAFLRGAGFNLPTFTARASIVDIRLATIAS
jgi:hypothetical protein